MAPEGPYLPRQIDLRPSELAVLGRTTRSLQREVTCKRSPPAPCVSPHLSELCQAWPKEKEKGRKAGRKTGRKAGRGGKRGKTYKEKEEEEIRERGKEGREKRIGKKWEEDIAREERLHLRLASWRPAAQLPRGRHADSARRRSLNRANAANVSEAP